MNKKVSKALAAVLSAAMAASAFAMSTSASFAAGSDVQFSVKDIPLTLTTKSSNYNLDSSLNITPNVTATKDGQTITAITLTGIDGEDWTSSNTNIAKVATNGTVTIDDKYVTSRQTVTFTKKYQATIQATTSYENGTHNEHNTGDTAVVTVKVVASIYPDGSYVILPNGSYSATTPLDSNETVSINETANFDIYKITGNDSATTFTSQDAGTADLSNIVYAVSNNLTTINSSSANGGVVGQTAAQPTNNVKTGSATITATATANGEDAEIQSASLTVENSFLYDGGTIDVVKNYGEDTRTESDGYNITGMDIEATANVTLDEGEIVGDIKAPNQVVTINDGTAENIEAAQVTVSNTSDNDVTVGNIDADEVTITGSTKANGPATTVGNVTADVDNSSYVTVTSSEATENGQTVGAGDVTVGNITTSGTLTLSADTINTMTLGNLSGVQGYYEDCPYTADLVVSQGTFNLNDVLYFGSITIDDEANVTVGDIDTGTTGTPDEGGTAVTSSLQVGGRLTADSIKVAKVTPDNGTIIVPVNSVEVTGKDAAPTDTTLLVKDAKVGDVLYTSTESNDDLFVMPGVKALEGKDSGKNVYTYTVTDLEFRGVLMEQTGTVEVGTAGTTLSVVKIPFTTNPPAGVSTVWETNKPDSVKLTPSADGLSCKVDAIGYTENNLNGSNDVTVTASLYKDGKPYSELDSQYASTSVDLTLTNAAPEAPANPFTVVVTNAEGEKITCDPNGSTVIEVPQSMAFNFDISSKETQPFDYTVGNGSIGGTNTNTVWNGTSGQYQIYAAGAVGSETGAYVNGIKIFTLKVTDRPFESDTTLNMDLKVGQKYQFEITLDDPAAPFTFLTADGAALSTSYNPDTYPAENGKYYCSVTAQQAGRDIGVYCVIDGKTYKIFTAHTVA